MCYIVSVALDWVQVYGVNKISNPPGIKNLVALVQVVCIDGPVVSFEILKTAI
jgi:hypothetical protein